MKGKKLLAGIISAAMVLGTMAFPVFADGGVGNGSVTVKGIAGFENKQYNTIQEAFEDISPRVEELAGFGETTCSREKFEQFYTDNGEITWTITGKQTFAADDNAYLFSFGRQPAYYGENYLTAINIIGGDDTAELVLEKNIILPYDWWGNKENEMNANFSNLTLTAESSLDYIRTAPKFGYNLNINYSNCTINGKFYSYWDNFALNLKFDNCNFNAPENAAYAIFTQGSGAGTITINKCNFTDYTRGVNFQKPNTDFVFTNNTIKSMFSEPDRGAVQITDGVSFDVTGNTIDVNGGNAFWFHSAAKNSNATYTISENNIKAPYLANDDTTFGVNDKITCIGNIYNDTDILNCMEKEAVEATKSTVETMMPVAQIGNKYYTTLKDAVAAAQNGDIIALLCDASGDGIVVPSGSEFTIDFGGHTYIVDGATVGSPNTQTNGFQLLKGSTLVFKNGKITSDKAFILIQNYSNLTLENMDLSLNNIDQYGRTLYTLSNNNGNTVITGNTNISALNGNVAFDIYSGSTAAYPSVSVTLDENMTGTINGNIEMSNSDNTTVDLTLKIKNGTINGNILDNRSAAEKDKNPKPGIISGGTFNTDVSNYCAPGFSPKLVNGKYVVDDSADTLRLTFVKHTDDERVYDIVLNGDGKDINRLNAAEFEFELSNTAMTYEIKAADKLTTLQPDANKYVFYFDGKDAIDNADSGRDITIGTVTFDGFGKFTFKAKVGKATATTTADNLVTEFVTPGEAGKGTLKINEAVNMIDTEIKVPTQKLTVNVAMEHNVGDNTDAYQDMTVAISGGDLAGKVLEYKLGDTANTAITKAMNGTMVASYQIKADLTKDRIYTVTVSGAGYRTSRYTVTMTEDKTMNFWNNDKTKEVTVIDDEKAKTTFLAGELVRDGKIDIYDLSAVVAYFGQKNIDKSQASKFAKYDLNRDGEIDIMDISIVLTSWGK